MLRQTKKISGFAPSHTGVGEGASLFKRFLVLIVCIALIGCFFALSVSAETVDGFEYDGIRVTGLDVNLISADGTPIPVEPTIVYDNSLENISQGVGYYVEFYNPNGLLVEGEYYEMVLFMTTASYLQTNNNYVIGGYDILIPWSYEVVGYTNFRRIGNGHTQYAEYKYTENTSLGRSGFDIYFDKGVLGLAYTSYVSSFRFRVPTNTQSFYVFIEDITLQSISPDEYASQSVIKNQDKNTQSIIDNEKELQENEKNEANSIGDEGVGEVTNAIPDYSSNLLEAFNKLTTPMIHEKTDCLIDFPEITVPSMNMSVMGVPITTPNVTLLQEQEINIETMAEKIPNSIMIVVKALLSIALYIFCYKEFYSIVEYIMTLKGAGK